MEKVKQIMYGVTDFARMRAENGYFVDCTAKAFGGDVAPCEKIRPTGKVGRDV